MVRAAKLYMRACISRDSAKQLPNASTTTISYLASDRATHTVPLLAQACYRNGADVKADGYTAARVPMMGKAN